MLLSNINLVANWNENDKDSICNICKKSTYETCPKCESLDESEKCKSVRGECSHYFHFHCIETWTKNSCNKCPIDRKIWKYSIAPDYEINNFPIFGCDDCKIDEIMSIDDEQNVNTEKNITMRKKIMKKRMSDNINFLKKQLDLTKTEEKIDNMVKKIKENNVNSDDENSDDENNDIDILEDSDDEEEDEEIANRNKQQMDDFLRLEQRRREELEQRSREELRSDENVFR